MLDGLQPRFNLRLRFPIEGRARTSRIPRHACPETRRDAQPTSHELPITCALFDIQRVPQNAPYLPCFHALAHSFRRNGGGYPISHLFLSSPPANPVESTLPWPARPGWLRNSVRNPRRMNRCMTTRPQVLWNEQMHKTWGVGGVPCGKVPSRVLTSRPPYLSLFLACPPCLPQAGAGGPLVYPERLWRRATHRSLIIPPP
jgi:hypothetical protein